MKEKKDLKKLALMGMAAGMLFGTGQAEALTANNGSQTDTSAYMAAGCGKGKCSTVADRSPSSNYYQGRQAGCSSNGGGHSCGNSGSHGNAGHSCGNKGGNGNAGHSCGNKGGNGSNGNVGHSCANKNSNQGYYDPSQWANNQNPNNTINNNANNNQHQAHNGCSAHGCSGKNNSTAQNNNNGNANNHNANQIAVADTHAALPQLNESDLLSKLNEQGKAAYSTLSPEGKKLALKLANAECKGKNECKGLNSCKTDKNECAGKGGCKGISNCSFKDKNLAVKVAATKMAEKRNGL